MLTRTTACFGNGDLSVSVYQTADRIIWRFGKGDVWDRRLDLSDDPKPAHIDEVANGIEKEGWKCPPYGGGPVEATKGTDRPERMKELCQGAPPSYNKRPYPCPKPVGELALQLPADQTGMQIHQQLTIEQAELKIVCRWPSGVVLEIISFIPPSPNVAVIQWKITGWTVASRTGNGVPPVWFPCTAGLIRQSGILPRCSTATIVTLRSSLCRPEGHTIGAPVCASRTGLAYIEQSFLRTGCFQKVSLCVNTFRPGIPVTWWT